MRRTILVLTMALLVVGALFATVPAVAQDDKGKEEKAKTEEKSKTEDKGKEEKAAEKDAEKDAKKEEEKLPKSGGISVNPGVLGLGAGALLVGGGLLAAKAVRRR